MEESAFADSTVPRPLYEVALGCLLGGLVNSSKFAPTACPHTVDVVRAACVRGRDYWRSALTTRAPPRACVRSERAPLLCTQPLRPPVSASMGELPQRDEPPAGQQLQVPQLPSTEHVVVAGKEVRTAASLASWSPCSLRCTDTAALDGPCMQAARLLGPAGTMASVPLFSLHVSDTSGRLTCACVSPSGRHVAAGTVSGELWVWQLRDGRPQLLYTVRGSGRANLPGRRQASPRFPEVALAEQARSRLGLVALSFTADEQWVATSDRAGIVRVRATAFAEGAVGHPIAADAAHRIAQVWSMQPGEGLNEPALLWAAAPTSLPPAAAVPDEAAFHDPEPPPVRAPPTSSRAWQACVPPSRPVAPSSARTRRGCWWRLRRRAERACEARVAFTRR